MLHNEERYQDPVLCYVYPDENIACFTTRQLDRQWGDDWNDAPYQSNSGGPYRWHPRHVQDRTDPWEIVVVKFDAPLKGPEDFDKENDYGQWGSWSVEEINRKEVPWLWSDSVKIYAGTTLSEFKAVIESVGGRITEESR